MPGPDTETKAWIEQRLEQERRDAFPSGDTKTKVLSWQLRALYAFCAYMLGMNMLDSAALGLLDPQSVSFKAASMTGYRQAVSVGFAVCMVLLAPFFVNQWFRTPPRRWPILLACAACFSASVLWMGVVYASHHADLSVLHALYVRQALEALFFMVSVAAGCNAQMKSAMGLTAARAPWPESNRVSIE